MRYPFATWIGSPNHGGPIGAVRLGVFHIMEGTLAGTDAWFQNPQSQVSAHFGVGKDGTLHQYVDTGLVAWAEAAYNSVAISIEHEGNSGDSLTAAQVATDAQLLSWLRSVVPLVRAADANGSGWLGHGELGLAGGNHPDCPGAPIVVQIPAVIAKAQGANVALINDPVDACLCPTGGCWVLGSDGGVGNYGGAPFHGSYPGLPAQDREGARTFLSIEVTAAGYSLIANDGNVYAFPTGDEPV